jgi:hypothetical protein
VSSLLDKFYGPTYGAMWLPGSGTVDHELRLYLPRRIPVLDVTKFLQAGCDIAGMFRLAAPGQLEVNRAGMCLCFSCGPEPREDILSAVNATRKKQNLKPIKL